MPFAANEIIDPTGLAYRFRMTIEARSKALETNGKSSIARRRRRHEEGTGFS